MQLRPIQKNTVDRITTEALKGHRKILVMLPTGTGKTVIAKHLIDSCIEKGNRALFTVPRIQLADQTANYFDKSIVSIIQGDNPRFDLKKPIQIATIQSLQNRDSFHFDLCIMDEVHWGYDGEMIQSIFRNNPNALFIGLSATPVDDRGYLLEGWDAIIDDYQLQDVIDEGWLVPLECYSGEKLKLDDVPVIAGEYKQDQLEQKVNIEPVLNSIFDQYQKHADGKKFILFALNKEHGNELNNLFNERGVKTAFVHSLTPQREREQYYNDFHHGKLTGIINIEILTAGYDEPTIEAVILATPSKSWRKYIQAVGRGVRLNGKSFAESCKNGKSKCILIDCANAIIEHGMPTYRKQLIFKSRISRVIDRELGIDSDNEARNSITITKERELFLRKIGSLLDLYEGKVYAKESELQEDVNNFLNKTDWFNFRQNSGKAFMSGRWVHFASKSGLPDSTLFYSTTSIYIGIELKLPTGYLTAHQKQTLPEMIQRGCLVFFAQSVKDVFDIILHVEKHVIKTDDGTLIKSDIRTLPPIQQKYFDKYIKKLIR